MPQSPHQPQEIIQGKTSNSVALVIIDTTIQDSTRDQPQEITQGKTSNSVALLIIDTTIQDSTRYHRTTTILSSDFNYYQ